MSNPFRDDYFKNAIPKRESWPTQKQLEELAISYPQQSINMEYRNFIIQPGDFSYTYVHKNYNGPEDKRTGFVRTVDTAKDVIDALYFDQTQYRVKTNVFLGTNIHKFAFWEDAVKFCNRRGIDYMNIETYVLGERVNFDSF